MRTTAYSRRGSKRIPARPSATWPRWRLRPAKGSPSENDDDPLQPAYIVSLWLPPVFFDLTALLFDTASAVAQSGSWKNPFAINRSPSVQTGSLAPHGPTGCVRKLDLLDRQLGD